MTEDEILKHQYTQDMMFTTKPISFEAWIKQRESAKQFANDLPYYNPFRKET
jgi:hypothetical protein